MSDGELHLFDEVAKWRDEMVDLMTTAAVGDWGEKCPDFEPDCPTCQVWAAIEHFRLWNTRAPAQEKGDDNEAC